VWEALNPRAPTKGRAVRPGKEKADFDSECPETSRHVSKEVLRHDGLFKSMGRRVYRDWVL
jgi:hypothetical protein